MSQQQVYKPDHRRQTQAFPVTIEELLPPNHSARFIDEFVNQLDISSILSTYKGGGTSAYHPGSLIKLLLYGYMDGCYSSRKLERNCKENICYMWLMGGQRPDHNTIANFRTNRLQGQVKLYFGMCVRKAYDLGVIQLKNQIVDGTIIESVANRYSYVWSKNVSRHKGNLENKILSILEEIDQALDQENADSKVKFSKIGDADVLKDKLDKLDEIENKELKKKSKN